MKQHKKQNGTTTTIRLVLMLLALLGLGCETGDGAANCVIETSYLCVDEGCFCADDTQWQNPLTEPEAEEVCGACRPSGEAGVGPDAFSISEYDRFGGVDDFSGDNDWSRGPR